MKILRRFGVVLIWVVALLLLAHATRGVAWGYEEPALQACRFGASTPFTIYTPPSSASGWTIVDINSRAVLTSVSCGPTSTLTWNLAGSGRQLVAPASCVGYSLKMRSDSTNGGCISYVLGTPVPPSLGAISVDTDDVEDRISEIFILSTWLGAFLLTFFIFFGVLFYFRRR